MTQTSRRNRLRTQPNRNTIPHAVWVLIRGQDARTVHDGYALCTRFGIRPPRLRSIWVDWLADYQLAWPPAGQGAWNANSTDTALDVLKDVATNGYGGMQALSETHGVTIQRVSYILREAGFDANKVRLAARQQAVLGLTEAAREQKLQVYSDLLAQTLGMSEEFIRDTLKREVGKRPVDHTWLLGNRANEDAAIYTAIRYMLTQNEVDISIEDLMQVTPCSRSVAMAARGYLRIVLRVLDSIAKAEEA